MNGWRRNAKRFLGLCGLLVLVGCQPETTDPQPAADVATDAPQDARTPPPSDAALDAGRPDVSALDSGPLEDAAAPYDSGERFDQGINDAAMQPDERLVDDPLTLSNDELFNCADGPDRLIPSRIWRLNRHQYAGRVGRVIRGTYRTEINASNPFEGIHSGEQFSEPANAFGMDGPTFDLISQNAETIAAYMTEFNRLWLLPRCVENGAPDGEAACWDETIRNLARSAWERPATDAEVERYLDSVRRLPEDSERLDRYRFIINAILLSPNTYFRTELGQDVETPEGRTRLTDHEVATALAHSILDGPPDDLLDEAADQGDLATADQIERQVRRLLNRRNDRKAVPRFFREFFGHDKALNVFKDPTEFPTLDRGSQVRSADFTIDYLVSIGGDTVGRLLTSTLLVPDVPLSCPSCADSEGLGIPGEPRRQDPDMRAGILTHRAWLMAHSRNDETDPVGRGRFIRERLLCTAVPDVPIGVIPQLPEPTPEDTMRDRLDAHNGPECQACHDQMDPLGLTFEMYDHVGLFQIGADSPIDPAGELLGAGNADGPVANAVELAHRLAESREVRKCFTRTAFRYWMGRDEQPGDACALSRMQRAVDDNDGDFEALLVALFTSDAFLYRRADGAVQ